jgi:hypothetical protein
VLISLTADIEVKPLEATPFSLLIFLTLMMQILGTNVKCRMA